MPPRPPLPSDDLYARLGVPRDASPEAIDLAWRGLLRKHHPDVAGPDAPRAREADQRRPRLAERPGPARPLRPRARRRHPRRAVAARDRAGRAAGRGLATRPAGHRRPPSASTPSSSGSAGSTRDELDRLALAEPAPIAFLATLRRFVPPELDAVIDRAERDGHREPAGRGQARPRDPRRGRRPARRHRAGRHPRGVARRSGRPARPGAPDARLGGGRRAAALRAGHGRDRRPAGAARGPHARTRSVRWRRPARGSGSGAPPWPRATSPEEDDALRVSSELAVVRRGRRDRRGRRASASATAHPPGGPRRAIAHLLVLRHAFPAREFERHAAPWLGTLIPRSAPWGARVGRRPASD